MVFTYAFFHTSVGNLLKRPDIVTYRNQLEVVPLKSLFFQAVLKLDLKDCFDKEIESMGKTCPILQTYYINLLYKHCLACILLI